jgi:transcriptional regulator with XRE-family HTH domain
MKKKCNFTLKELQDMFFDTEKIKEEIKKARQLLGRTQTDMANALGVTQGAYGRLESGKTKMTIDQLNKVCEYLGISLVDLLTPSEQKDNYEAKTLIAGMENAVKILQDEIKKNNKKKS